MTTMISRPQRRIPALIAALIVLAIGVGALWVAIEHIITGTPPSWYSASTTWLASLTWGTWVAIAISSGVGLLGLIAISVVRPGRVSALALKPGTGNDRVQRTEVVIARRSVARVCAARATKVDGVDGVTTSVTSRKVQLTVRSRAADGEWVRGEVAAAVRNRLEQLQFVQVPSVTVKVRSAR